MQAMQAMQVLDLSEPRIRIEVEIAEAAEEFQFESQWLEKGTAWETGDGEAVRHGSVLAFTTNPAEGVFGIAAIHGVVKYASVRSGRTIAFAFKYDRHPGAQPLFVAWCGPSATMGGIHPCNETYNAMMHKAGGFMMGMMLKENLLQLPSQCDFIFTSGSDLCWRGVAGPSNTSIAGVRILPADGSTKCDNFCDATVKRLRSVKPENAAAPDAWPAPVYCTSARVVHVPVKFVSLGPFMSMRLEELKGRLASDERVAHLMQAERQFDDVLGEARILRFLTDQNQNVDLAFNCIVAFLEWRVLRGVAVIRQKLQKISTWDELCCVDHNWRLYHEAWVGTFYEWFGEESCSCIRVDCPDASRIAFEIEPEHFKNWFVACLEYRMIKFHERQRRSGRLCQVIWCMRVPQRLGVDMILPLMAAVTELADNMRKYYGETLHTMLMVEAPKVFQDVWNLLSPLVPQKNTKQFLIKCKRDEYQPILESLLESDMANKVLQKIDELGQSHDAVANGNGAS